MSAKVQKGMGGSLVMSVIQIYKFCYSIVYVKGLII